MFLSLRYEATEEEKTFLKVCNVKSSAYHLSLKNNKWLVETGSCYYIIFQTRTFIVDIQCYIIAS